MFQRILLIALLITMASTDLSAKDKPSKKDWLVTLHTSMGDITLLLFEDTPLHRENFLKLSREGFYDSTSFHRVINGFMIQGGDPHSRPGGDKRLIGQGGPGYTIKAEIQPNHHHIAGALAAARQGDMVNPERESSGSQFYIVLTDKGAKHLDGAYSLFGQVIEGMDVVTEIGKQAVNVQMGNRPLKDIRIESVELVELKKKKITKIYGYEYP